MDRPKDLPNRLECAYCSRNGSHGGECNGKNNRDEIGCLYFKMDERGCIKRDHKKIPIPVYKEIPPLNVWVHDRWLIYDNDTSVRIISIKGLTWDEDSGDLNIYADCEYYVNEFLEEYKENNKPKLKAIKGGKINE